MDPSKVTELVQFLSSQKPRILFNILNQLPRYGVGRKVTRIGWSLESNNEIRPTYWVIKKVVPNEDMKSGKVWGLFTHRGKVNSRLRHVQRYDRRQWVLLPKDFDYRVCTNTGQTNTKSLNKT